MWYAGKPPGPRFRGSGSAVSAIALILARHRFVRLLRRHSARPGPGPICGTAHDRVRLNARQDPGPRRARSGRAGALRVALSLAAASPRIAEASVRASLSQRNATSYADRRGSGCPSARAMSTLAAPTDRSVPSLALARACALASRRGAAWTSSTRLPLLVQSSSLRTARTGQRDCSFGTDTAATAVPDKSSAPMAKQVRRPIGAPDPQLAKRGRSAAHRSRRRDFAERAGDAGCRRNASVARTGLDPDASGSPRRAGLDHHQLLIRRRNPARRWAWLRSAGWSAGRR